MSNTLFFSLAALAAAALIGFALMAPQGLGARSPAPFGHPLAPLRAVGPAAPPAGPAPPLRGEAQ